MLIICKINPPLMQNVAYPFTVRNEVDSAHVATVSNKHC